MNPREILAIVVLLFATQTGRAVIVGAGNGSGNTNAPSGLWGDAGWSYVGKVNGGSGIYLGEYGGGNWVITAGHVFNDGGNRSFILNGTSYDALSGSGIQISGIDLYVYRISVGAGTGLSLLANLSLSGTSPTPGNPLSNSSSDPLCMIGYGKDRAASVTYWNVNTSSWTWTETSAGSANATGFKELGSQSKRWGYNYADQITTVNGTSMIQTTFRYSANDGTTFSTQAAVGDSGGGVFKLLDNGAYELAGLMDLVTTLPNQPANTAILNSSLTYSIDVASYRSAILDAVPEPSSYALVGLGGFLLLLGCRSQVFGMRNSQATRLSR